MGIGTYFEYEQSLGNRAFGFVCKATVRAHFPGIKPMVRFRLVESFVIIQAVLDGLRARFFICGYS